MAEIMDTNKTAIYASLFNSAFNSLFGVALDRRPHPAGTDWLYLSACPDIMAGKHRLGFERQACIRFDGCAGGMIFPHCLYTATGKADYILLISFANNNCAGFLPVNIPTF